MKFPEFISALMIFLTLNISLFAQQPAKTRADKQFDKALKMYYDRDFANSARQLDELLNEEPTYTKAWLLKAEMYYDMEENVNAVSCYKKAVGIDSVTFPQAYYSMANLYFEMENYDLAKENYLKYLSFKPKKQAELKRITDNLLLCD